MVAIPWFDGLAIMSPKCDVDIYVDFTPEKLNPLFCQCKCLNFTLDTVNLHTDCIFL